MLFRSQAFVRVMSRAFEEVLENGKVDEAIAAEIKHRPQARLSAEDLRAQILGQLSERLNYDRLYQEALSDPELKRTQVELEAALSNSREARQVVFDLFQDLGRRCPCLEGALGSLEPGRGRQRFLGLLCDGGILRVGRQEPQEDVDPQDDGARPPQEQLRTVPHVMEQDPDDRALVGREFQDQRWRFAFHKRPTEQPRHSQGADDPEEVHRQQGQSGQSDPAEESGVRDARGDQHGVHQIGRAHV